MSPRVVWEHRPGRNEGQLAFRIVQKSEDRGYNDNRVYVAEFSQQKDAMGNPLWVELPGGHAEFLMYVSRELDRLRGLVGANDAARRENR